MSTEAEANPAKKKGGMVKKLILPIVLLGAGAGGVYGAMLAGVIGGHGEEKKEDNKPKLIKKGEEDPFAVKKEGDKEGEGGGAERGGAGGSDSRPSSYPFPGAPPPTPGNPPAPVRGAAACPPRRDGRVLMWLKKHELAIRSRMLEVLADTPEEDIYTIEGKDRLQKRLTAAINKVLTETEGFGGVDAVYFRSMLVQ